jgi:outer membrane protein assembly factor BamE (lipoprotein component of BamABCDE complex)
MAHTNRVGALFRLGIESAQAIKIRGLVLQPAQNPRMKKRLALLLAAALSGFSLAGCGVLKEAVFGRENPLAPLAWATLGATPRDEIMRKFGAPEEIDKRWFEAFEADVFFYYDVDGADPPRYQFLACEFSKGVLTAYAYHGSAESAPAAFDGRERSKLVTGQSTRQDVEKLLGAPSGKARLPTTITLPALDLRLGGAPFPLAKIPDAAQEAWQYHSQGFSDDLRKTSQQALSVFFDADGLFVGSALLQEQVGKF